VSSHAFPESSKWSMIDRYCVSLSDRRSREAADQVMIHASGIPRRSRTKATIWFFVMLEMTGPPR